MLSLDQDAARQQQFNTRQLRNYAVNAATLMHAAFTIHRHRSCLVYFVTLFTDDFQRRHAICRREIESETPLCAL